MPLDVQPLSNTRRALMLVVLLALLGASLAFAQFLVLRKTPAPLAELFIDWKFPRELNRPVPAIEQLQNVKICRTGIVKGHRRQLAGLIQRLSPPATPDAWLFTAREMLAEVSQAPPLREGPATLAHRPAIEVQGVSDHGAFAVLRMTVVGGQAIAICYSGPDEITDADKLYFNDLCDHLQIREELPHTGK